ncbi:MAG: hypothetical protein HQL21_02200 [Candidatus Omnitrophica bacterium]|nr:hypothetical protein [Candidatus Omnitrophota bacterium]
MSRTIFAQCGVSQVPRILGFIDQDSASSTYGCADRAYWHYKTIDFSNARFQEAALVLALAYLLPMESNRFYRKDLIKDWAMAAINFWAKSRHADGSTDESYPSERHFCSTAFSLYSVTEALVLLGEKPRQDFGVSGTFLIRNDNSDVANQEACAALALYNLSLVSGEETWKAAADVKIGKLLRMQTKDGSFLEYGGFDLGYDTITLSFLAGLYQKTSRADIKAAAERLIAKIQPFMDEDGYFSNEGMSRRTQFVYPYGFRIFAPAVLQRLEGGLQKDVILNPSWMDDRYCMPLTANYLMTGFTEGRS